MKSKKFTFIDLFSGIGGFHQALSDLGGECVFASEINKECINLYKKNYNIDADFDITEVNEKDIPKHDVLCAGFPCQTFSKAGKRAGMEDARGTLFFDIARILKYHKTKYILLENVRNLTSHDYGNSWKVIMDTLNQLGYRLSSEKIILSPHQFGIPQLRERVFIVGVYDPKNKNKPIQMKFNELKKKEDNNIYDILQKTRVADKYYISEEEKFILNAWDEFYKGINRKVIGFPIWADFFKVKRIPREIPKWKKDFLIRNQNLYNENKVFIDKWLKKYNNLKNFTATNRKFEWQAGESIDSLWQGVIQFRPSGIRVKKSDAFPALVALVQIPIIGKYQRRLTTRECARIQSFPDSFKIDTNIQKAYRQFGNSVNVEVVKSVFNLLVDNE